MEKLLHERLREFNIGREDTVSLKSGYGLAVSEYEAVLLADEIERDYIPLPCDPEGKPWKIGDEAISGEGETFTVQGVGYADGRSYLVNVDSGTVYDAEWCKRPQPKVLDADGVEIKVGENRYVIRTGEYVAVNSVNDDYCLCTVLGDDCTLGTCGYKPTELSTKEPDSLNKAVSDMREYIGLVGLPAKPQFDEWLDRLSALIERGA